MANEQHKTTEAVVVLHGGGADSLVLAWQAFKMGCPEVHLVWYDFGQVTAPMQKAGMLHTARRIQEAGGVCKVVTINVADMWRTMLGPKHREIDQFHHDRKITPRTISDLEEAFEQEGVSSYAQIEGFGWIPGRNMFFLTNAAIYAASHGIYRVMWAMENEIASLRETRWQEPNQADDMWFPFLERLNLLLVTALGFPCEVVSPFMHFTKLEVARLGLGLGLTIDDFAAVYSCEHDPICWVCEQCDHTKRIYNELGIYPEWFPEEHKNGR